jgi:pyruvate/2-oxoglutarate dehydrogenase complex dihydrolipoamide acyltransferase (E2) component
MVGHQDSNPDGWTFATLYKHVTALSDASKEAVAAALASAQKAADKAEAAQQLRNEVSNEWRDAMKDKDKNFADKEQTERRLALLEQELARRAGAERGVGIIGSIVIGSFGVIAVIISAATFVLNRH